MSQRQSAGEPLHLGSIFGQHLRGGSAHQPSIVAAQTSAQAPRPKRFKRLKQRSTWRPTRWHCAGRLSLITLSAPLDCLCVARQGRRAARPPNRKREGAFGTVRAEKVASCARLIGQQATSIEHWTLDIEQRATSDEH